MRTLVLFLLAVSLSAAADVARFGRFEQSFTSSKEYGNPLKDADVTVEFAGPGNIKDVVRAFWDGGKTWKVRYSPEVAGDYSFKVKNADTGDQALNSQSGTFHVTEASGRNPVYRYGAPRLSSDRHYLVQSAARPFFYLADTAWNGALLSNDAEWKQYLADRAEKGFTAIQIVMTQWRGGLKDENGQVAYEGTNPIKVNPAFFQRMDRKIQAINDAGLVAVPVILWALGQGSPGVDLPTAQATLLAKYIASRYSAYSVIWMLGGDGDYTGSNAEKWRSIGEAVFPRGAKRALVGMHPRGMQDPWQPFLKDGWLDILFFQSGHGNNPLKWQWEAAKGMATEWNATPYHPVIDAEINYEGHRIYQSNQAITDKEVRRAAYYSLLAGQTAGVTYGAHGIWAWSRNNDVPLNHPSTGPTQPWNQCLNYPGAQQMKVLRSIMDSVEWWRLRPERYLVRHENQNDKNFEHYIMASLTEREDLGMMYFPDNTGATLNLSRFNQGSKVEGTWVDPRTGQRTPAGLWDLRPDLPLKMPGPGDWILILRNKK